MPQLPTLAPRVPGNFTPAAERVYCKEHTEDEWESKRELIRKLYINDNRKLNDTMAILKAKYGFSATEQMYKKRLKKWNIRKRTYRKNPIASIASTPTATTDTPTSGDSEADADVEDITRSYDDDDDDDYDEQTATTLIQPSNIGPYLGLEQVLTSVFSWSQSQLERGPIELDPMSQYLANPNSPPIQDSRTMYRTFELVFDLWYHGKGDLAGMAARKGFYVLEYVLTRDHPDLIWHVLDTIFDMADRGHLQLLGMFLEHAYALSRRQFPPQHPLVNILRQLRQCDYQTEQGRRFVCQILRRAWLRNVDLLSQHIGTLLPHHLWLYEQLIWDGRTRLRKESELSRKRDAMNNALNELAAYQEGRQGDDESVQMRIGALMLEFTQMDLQDRKRAEQLALELLQLTGLKTDSKASARFHAYARKMLARTQQDQQDWSTAEENLQKAISKRETAHGTNNNLRVVRDMWVLAAHYQKAGRPEDAEKTTQDALRRAAIYLYDLPG